MKKRFLIYFVAFMLLASAFSSCSSTPANNTTPTTSTVQASPSATATPEPVPKKPLRIMWWGSQTRHDRTLAVLDLYAKQTGIEFEPEFYGFDDYIAKLNTLIAANDPPDIMQMGGNFPTYIDHIEYLNPYIENGAIDTSGTDPSFIAITSLDGNTVGISSGTNATAIAYDPELFKQAGVAEPTKNWTWEEFEKDCMTIHEKLGIFGFAQEENNEFTLLTSIIQQYGTNEGFFKEPYRLQLNYTDDKYISDYLNMFNKLTKAEAYPNPAQMAEIKDIEGNPLVRGESAMTWLYSNQFVALLDAAGRPLKLINMPRRYSNGILSQTIQSSQMFCISKESQQKDEAAKFLRFWVNSVDANLILKGERGVPIMRQVRDALSEELTPAEKAIYDYITSIGAEASMNIQLDSPVQTEIRDIYIRLSEEVKFDKTTPEDAATKLRAQAQDVISRYNAGKN